VNRRFLRLVCAIVLGLMFYDNIADAAGCHDSPTATATTCHACPCGSHIFSQEPVPAVVVLQPTAYVPYEASVYAILLPQFIFHPPRPIA